MAAATMTGVKSASERPPMAAAASLSVQGSVPLHDHELALPRP